PAAPQELNVMGRGPAQRLEVIPERTAIHAGGRDSTIIKIRAFDRWGHPATDDQLGIESSLGQVVRLEAKPDDDGVLVPGRVLPNPDLPANIHDQQEAQTGGQVVVPLEKGEARVRLVGPGQTGEARLHVVAGQLEAESTVRIISE